jgi:hypothetical protein
MGPCWRIQGRIGAYRGRNRPGQRRRRSISCGQGTPRIVVTDTYNLSRFSDLRPPGRFADRRALVRWVRVGESRAGLGRIGGRNRPGSDEGGRSHADKGHLSHGRWPAASRSGHLRVGVSQHPAGDSRASRKLNEPWTVTWDGPVTRTSSSLQPSRPGPVPDRRSV